MEDMADTAVTADTEDMVDTEDTAVIIPIISSNDLILSSNQFLKVQIWNFIIPSKLTDYGGYGHGHHHHGHHHHHNGHIGIFEYKLSRDQICWLIFFWMIFFLDYYDY